MAEKPEGDADHTPPPTLDLPTETEPITTEKPTKKTTRSKLRLSREQWTVVVLLGLTIELGLRAALGSWKSVAVTNLVLGTVILGILAIRAALKAATSRTRNSKNSKNGSGTGSSNPNGRRSSMPSLGKLLSRKRAPNSNGSTGSGRSRSPFGGLFGGKRPGGGRSPGGYSRNPLRNMFGKHRPSGGGHPTGGNRPGGANKRRNPFAGVFGGKRPGGAPRGGANGNRPGGGGKRPRGGGPGGVNRRGLFGGLFGGSPDHAGRNKKAHDKKPNDKKPPSDKSSKPDKTEPNDEKKTSPDQPPIYQNSIEDTKSQPKSTEEGDRPVTQTPPPSEGIGAPRGNSLHAWGRTLPKVGEVLDDLKRRHQMLEAEAQALLADVNMLSTLGETNHVRTTRIVVSQLQSIANDLRQIVGYPTSDALAKVIGKSSALWPTYLRDCGADEDRVNGVRGTRAQERNADVRTAEQDI